MEIAATHLVKNGTVKDSAMISSSLQNKKEYNDLKIEAISGTSRHLLSF